MKGTTRELSPEEVQEAFLNNPLTALAGKTRSSLAHQAHARAHERADRLAVELKSAFEELWQAQADLKKLGIETNVTLPFPISEAWFDWRAKQQLK